MRFPIRSLKPFTILLFGILICAPPVSGQEAAPPWMTQGPHLENKASSFELPFHLVASKMYVDVELGGKARRFVFDTGSPSMIDQALADELGLQPVGKSQGRDSHGNMIESNIVQTALKLGDTTIQMVPMFAADFSGSVVTQCLIGDGVLGSELLPLGAWQIDRAQGVIRFNTDASKLPAIKKATKTPLYTYGYPHIPYLDVQYAKRATSKAMFDTGSPAYFAISSADLQGAKDAGGIGKTVPGFGSAGGSLGGQAPNADQLQAELKGVSIGKIKLGRVGAVKRELSPSLIGAGILGRYVVTLDVKSQSAYFSKYAAGDLVSSSFGFTLAFNGGISVAAVWDNSPAKEAGLYPGLQFTEINGVEPAYTCAGIQEALQAMQADEINLAWETGATSLTRKTHILQ